MKHDDASVPAPLMAARRWLRLDVGWSHSAWLSSVPPCARLAWIELLGHVKTHGVRGIAKGLNLTVAAKVWDIPEEDVRSMIGAAVNDGALNVENGDWTVVNWVLYQEPDPTSAERSQRYRESKSRLSQSRRDGVTDRDVTVGHGVTGGGNGVTRHATGTGDGDTVGSSEIFPKSESIRVGRRAARRSRVYSEPFGEVWAVHPRGVKSKAADRYDKAVANGITHDELLRCLTAYVADLRDDFRGAHLERWIRDERWEEIQAKPEAPADSWHDPTFWGTAPKAEA